MLLMGVLLAMPLSFTSCSDDEDDGGGATSADLLGAWKQTSFYGENIIYDSNGKQIGSDPWESYSEVYYIAFYEGGTYKLGEAFNNSSSYIDLDDMGTWSIKNGKITMNSIEDDNIWWYEYTVTLNGSKLIIEEKNDDGENDEWMNIGMIMEMGTVWNILARNTKEFPAILISGSFG